MPCHKIRYDSRPEAKKAIRTLNKNQGLHLTDVYYCGNCLGYHTTSMNKKDSRKLKKRRK